MRTYRQVLVHKFVIKTAILPIFVQNVSHKYINTSLKYHRLTCTQYCVIKKVHVLLGQPSYIQIFDQHAGARASSQSVGPFKVAG